MHQLWQTALSPAREPIPSECWLRTTSGFSGSDDAPSQIQFEKCVALSSCMLTRQDLVRASFVPGLIKYSGSACASPTRVYGPSLTLQTDLQIARLPGHHLISASTLADIATPVLVQHRIVLRVTYLKEGRPRQLTVSKPLELSSCVRR